MNGNNPEYIKCAMEALEEGISAYAIKEECACRMGIPSAEFNNHNPTHKE